MKSLFSSSRLLVFSSSRLLVFSSALLLLSETASTEPVFPSPPVWDASEDADQDGLRDEDELLLFGMDPLDPEDGLADDDGDGLTTAEELFYQTDPDLADTDGDTWNDGDELMVYETDPLDPQSFPQGDGVQNPDTAESSDSFTNIAPQTLAALEQETPPASLSDGDFNDLVVNDFKYHSGKDYQDQTFHWGTGATNENSWTAYNGSKIEVWKSATGERFIELDGWSEHYGVKQAIKNVALGSYILTWQHSGRTNLKAGNNAYTVKVYYLIGETEKEVATTGIIDDVDIAKWTPQALSFKITQEHIAAAGDSDFYVAFIPTNNDTYGTLIDKVELLSADMKVTDFVTKSDKVPYVATTNATPPKNLELCLKAETTNETAKIEIELPNITDAAMLAKMKWKVVKKPEGTMVSEGVFGGSTPPSAELSLGSGSSVEDEILFEVQVGAVASSFTPVVKMNVRVVRDRLNWWFEPFSQGLDWRTAKPEPREDTGDYKRKQIINADNKLVWVPDPLHPDHHPNAYKCESLQSVYKFFKETAPGIAPNFGSPATDAGQAKTRSWIKPEITCFAEFHDQLKQINGDNPLIDLNSLLLLKLNQTLDLEGAAGRSNLQKVLKHLIEKQTKVTVSSSPLLNYTDQKGVWAKNAATQIDDARLEYYDLLAFWQKEGSMTVRPSPELTGAFLLFDAPAPTTEDEAKVIFIAKVFWGNFGMDSLNPHKGAGADNRPDLANLKTAITYIQGQVDRLLGPGQGVAYFATLDAAATAPGIYDVSSGEPFYTFTLKLLGKMILTDYWRQQGVVATYCNYNMGSANFNGMIASLSSPNYPERARLGLEDWGWHYEVRVGEWANPPEDWPQNKPGIRPNATRFWYFREIFKNLTTP